MDTRRTFNGTIPEPTATDRAKYLLDLITRIDNLEQELCRQQRINRMLCLVIEGQAIKVTVKGVDG